MTERQGEVYKLESALTRIISNVMCQSFKTEFSNKKVTKKIIQHVSNKFSDPLFKKTSNAFFKIFNTDNYKVEIKNAMLDEIERNKLRILSSGTPKKQTGGGLPRKKTRTYKNRITRRHSPTLEINPHPPLLTVASPPNSK